MSIFQDIAFYTSVNNLRELPQQSNLEIAFAGRSNAGKSSVINTLTNRGRLAFVSKTPGRTQLINYFKLNNNQFLVDLPGYGYAKVPVGIRQHWEHLLSTYLQTRRSLCGLVLIIDVRHPLKPLDIQMLDWFTPTGKLIHILLTKADKLSRQQAIRTLKSVKSFLLEAYPLCTVQLFSSTTADGSEEALAVLGNWLQYPQ